MFMFKRSMIDVNVTVFFKCSNAAIPLTCTLANVYPSSNEISKKNGTVRGDCIACGALLLLSFEENKAWCFRMHMKYRV